jgi:hypothetical protein
MPKKLKEDILDYVRNEGKIKEAKAKSPDLDMEYNMA